MDGFPHGHAGYRSTEYDLMYSIGTPFQGIRCARPALTAFAVQTVEKKLLREVRDVTKVSSGLHVWTPGRGGKPGSVRVEWDDLGINTMSEVQDILKRHQPLTWHYLMKIATPKERKKTGATAVAVRRSRPTELVSSTP